MKTLYTFTPLMFASLFFFSLFTLTGCGTTAAGRLATPSGRPEILIPNATIQRVMDGVASWLASQGKPIESAGVYTISTSFPSLSETKTSVTSVYTIVQNGENVELYERTESTHGGELTEQSDYEDMQKELTQIAEYLKGR